METIFVAEFVIFMLFQKKKNKQ